MEVLQEMLQYISRMKWSDYLDIIIVAAVVYKLLPYAHNTGTTRIVRVVIAIVLLSWVTDLLNLYTTHFIINSCLQVGLIALIVLFQPELRRMLDHIGNMKLDKLLGTEREKAEMAPVISQTVMACETMSRERVGALIVFERDNMLTEYFKTGTLIDGQVSEQLLRNIFFPKAALHDGAVIIRDGRVAAAGCVLPLSSSDRLSADLGTRHRAGVGMSEVSDAVVVIVSEETGTISVAMGGMLKRHLAAQTLEKLLTNEFCPASESEDNVVVRLRQKLRRKDKEGKE